jgi:predicted amidophosphoribosyltransferase
LGNGGIMNKKIDYKRPDYELQVTLFCPDCGKKLETNVCEQCGCVIDTDSFNETIDINPEEIL